MPFECTIKDHETMEHSKPSYLSCGWSVAWADLVPIAPNGDVRALLESKLIILHKPRIGPPQRTQLWTVARYGTRAGTVGLPGAAMYVCVPRCWLWSLVHVQRLLPPPRILWPAQNRIRAVFRGELDENQQIVFDWLMRERFTPAAIRAGVAAALLNMQAGLGKTFVAAALIAALGLRTLYVVLRDNLRVQAIDDMQSVLDCRIEPWTANADPVPDVAVIIVNSATTLTAEQMRDYSFVIYDEVHAFASPGRRAILRSTMTWVNLGMSATTDERADALDAVYHKELALGGEVRAADLPGFNPCDVLFWIDVDVVSYYGPLEHTETLIHPSTGAVFTPWMQKQLIADRWRTRVIAEHLAALYNEVDASGQPLHGIYVFAEEREHLEVIFADLSKMFERNGWLLAAPEIGRYVGGAKRNDIRRIVAECRVFLTTYGYSSAGVSVGKMSAIILATPRKAGITQIIGRICRRNGDPQVRRRIIDIVDACTPFRKQASVREAAYMLRDRWKIDPITGKPTKERVGYVTVRASRIHWTRVRVDDDAAACEASHATSHEAAHTAAYAHNGEHGDDAHVDTGTYADIADYADD